MSEPFRRLMKDFENFVKNSHYLNIIDQIPNDYKWHDQDFFRYFYRKTMRTDIGVFDLEQVFTTTRGGAKCVNYDNKKKFYRTAWGKVPFMVHFAGGTLEKVQANNIGLNDNSLKKFDNYKTKNEYKSEVFNNNIWCNDNNERNKEKFEVDCHGVFLRENMEQLIIRWIEKTPNDCKIILIGEEQCEAIGKKLAGKYPNIKEFIILSKKLKTFNIFEEYLKKKLYKFRLNSIVIPAPVEHKIIEFLPGNSRPEITKLYDIVKLFWKNGFRNFAFQSYGGVKIYCIPFLLDGLKQIHKDKRCFIVGNGPSLNMIDMGLLRNEITFGSNRCYLGFEKWGFAFNYWGVMDRLQIEKYCLEYEENIPSKVIKFFPFEYLNMFEFSNICPVNFSYSSRPPYEFSCSPDKLKLGFTVTHMLMQIASIMGCNPIYLIGCDHNYNIKNKNSSNGSFGEKNAIVWKAKDAKSPTHFCDNYTQGEEKLFVTPKLDKAELAFQEAYKWAKNNRKQIF